ncbi:MAG: hypothetical protein QF632_01430 [Candidatus Woesearchaeota archaeon]|jgi:hypothetical protein|nr:hypothetical protein [Candidatus Woesearchaeota archaeon]MDP7323404.1 hypothetical protein [Candidatus Woesearchaeota archaeon]MDP7457515.1 hypothetical protein [Candidatus Woesearchaeota archaeon]
MKHRNVLVLLILIGILLGCDSPLSGGYVGNVDLYKGTNGVVLGLIEEFPPKVVFEGADLVMALELENKGAFDVDNGVLALSLEQDYMRLNAWNHDNKKKSSANKNIASFTIRGKSFGSPVGETKVITANLDSLILERQTETHTSNMVVTACYPYTTHFEENICIDTNIFSPSPVEKNCKISDSSFSGQGAPVAVVKRKSKMIPRPDGKSVDPSFTLTLKNVGKGEIIHEQAYSQACSSGPLTKKDFNRIIVEAELAGRTLRCRPEEFQLTSQRDSITCDFPAGISTTLGSYITPLVVTLRYGYTESISKQIEIRRLGP